MVRSFFVFVGLVAEDQRKEEEASSPEGREWPLRKQSEEGDVKAAGTRGGKGGLPLPGRFVREKKPDLEIGGYTPKTGRGRELSARCG